MKGHKETTSSSHLFDSVLRGYGRMPQIYISAISGDDGSSGTSNWFERNFNHQLMKRTKPKKIPENLSNSSFIQLFCAEFREKMILISWRRKSPEFL